MMLIFWDLACKTDINSFAISQKPTPEEQYLMKDWIKILVAFVNNDTEYDFGTKAVQELKIATPEGTIEVQPDLRWDRLIAIGKVFAGCTA